MCSSYDEKAFSLWPFNVRRARLPAGTFVIWRNHPWLAHDHYDGPHNAGEIQCPINRSFRYELIRREYITAEKGPLVSFPKKIVFVVISNK